MTYRNDHEAAVARLDALQQEVKRLSEENATLRRPTAKARKTSSGVGLASLVGGSVVAAFGCLLIGLSSIANGSPPAPEPVLPEIGVVEVAHGLDDISRSLVDCAKTIAPRPVVDPHKPLDVAALERTGASCRKALRELAAAYPVGRDSVSGWSLAEEQLTNRISLLTVYYGSNPAVVDNYAAAPRLWAEYDEALASRNKALNVWRSRR